MFKKKVNLRQSLVVLGVLVLSIVDKNFPVFWYDGVDVLWHLVPSNIGSGFPAFFVFKAIIDFFSFDLAFYLLPLVFSSMIAYVFLVWLNQKKVNLWVLLFLCYFFFRDFMFFVSPSREPVIILFALLFFYFLEKHFYKSSRKNLVSATLFLVLACLTKITGFLLIPFYLWVLLKKRGSLFYLLPVIFVFLFMLFKTNLAGGLFGETNVISLEVVLVGFAVLLFSNSVVWLFVFFPPFVKFNNFLWRLNFFVLVLILVVGLRNSFLSDLVMVLPLERYFVIFLLPLILWLSVEFDLFFVRLKGYLEVWK